MSVNSKSRGSRRLGGVLLGALTLSLVPVLCATGLTISGVPSALACSAGAGPAGPTDGVNSFRVQRDETLEQVAVANDGFFMIEVIGVFATPEDLLASIVTEVTNGAGEPVAGSLHTFPSRAGLYWLADSALADGSYTATVAAPANPRLASESVKLEAKGAPSELALPSVEPKKWLEYRRLTGGKRLTCQAPGGGCGGPQFGELEETSVGLQLRIFPSAPINGQVYWDIDVKSVDTSDEVYRSGGAGFLRQGNETGVEFHFSKTLPEHCAVLTATDRRNEQQLISAPICWKPEAPEVVDETNVIANCPESPSPALLAIWCRYHQDSDQCRDIAGGATSPGTAGNTGSPDGSARAGAAGSAPNGASAEADGAPEDHSNACSLGHSRTASSLGTFALLALAALGLRRKLRVGG